MKWRPVLYCSPSHQPQQPIAPVQYSNLKRVGRLRATLYIHVCQGGCCVLQILSVSTASFCVIVKLSDGGHNRWPKYVLVNKLIYSIRDVLFRK